MAIFNLNHAITGLLIRTISGDSFSRAVENEVAAGRTLANADLRLLGRNGDPQMLNLKGAVMTNAVMDDAVIVGSDLSNADLSNASLKRTDQRNTIQRKVTVTGLTETGSRTDGRDGR